MDYSDPSALTTPSVSEPTYHGISLKSLYYAESVEELVPKEEQPVLYSRKHRRRYLLLEMALHQIIKIIIARHAREREEAPENWARQMHQAAADFHSEFSRRMGWDTTALVANPGYRDNEFLEASRRESHLRGFGYPDPIRKQAADSRFPSINTFIEYYPKYSVASIVQDFYMRQEEQLSEYRVLQSIKHRWEICEKYYIFHRAVVQLRRMFTPKNTALEGKGLSWFKILTGDPSELVLKYAPHLYEQETSEEAEMGTPAGDEKRRRQQFETLKEIQAYLKDEGIRFPSRFCPGNLTMMEFFQPGYTFPGPPWTDEAAKTLFLPYQTIEEQDEQWENPKWQKFVRKETQKMLRCESIHKYYDKIDWAGVKPKRSKGHDKGKRDRKKGKRKKPMQVQQEEMAEVTEPRASEFLQTASSVNMQTEEATVPDPGCGRDGQESQPQDYELTAEEYRRRTTSHAAKEALEDKKELQKKSPKISSNPEQPPPSGDTVRQRPSAKNTSWLDASRNLKALPLTPYNHSDGY